MKKIIKESEELEEPIRACMNCGHAKLDYIGKDSIDVGALALGSTLTGTYRCRDCGFEGVPLEFYNTKDYEKFIKMKDADKKAGRLAKPIIGVATEGKAETTSTQIPLATRMQWASFKLQLIIVIIFLILIAAAIIITS